MTSTPSLALAILAIMLMGIGIVQLAVFLSGVGDSIHGQLTMLTGAVFLILAYLVIDNDSQMSKLR